MNKEINTMKYRRQFREWLVVFANAKNKHLNTNISKVKDLQRISEK